jgi:regulator of sirC expression with transglutaminase-like and TPR domain
VGHPRALVALAPVEATRRFVALMRQPVGRIRLDEACLLVAAHAHADDAVERVVAEGMTAIDELAAGCAQRGVNGSDIDDVRAHLFGDLGFTGNQRRYDDPRNSYLDMVIARRTGIPITLSIVVIESARRLGVELTAVGMPGHFLVGVGGDRYLDAFDAGRIIGPDECRRRLEMSAGASVEWTPDLLAPIGPHAVLARVLANLRRVFVDSQDLVGLDWVLQLRAAIPGVPRRERGERAAVLTALGRYDEAASELEDWADIEDSEDLRHQALRLRAKLN